VTPSDGGVTGVFVKLGVVLLSAGAMFTLDVDVRTRPGVKLGAGRAVGFGSVAGVTAVSRCVKLNWVGVRATGNTGVALEHESKAITHSNRRVNPLAVRRPPSLVCIGVKPDDALRATADT
jgi:hypothetical protein